jgi:MFS family permease
MNKVEQQHAIGSPERRATRLIFFLCGTGQAAWAPLVPFAKARLHVNDQQFGILLLCFGVGSILSMPAVGTLTGRLGCKRLIQISALCLCLALAGLSVAPAFLSLALALIFFGASVGSLDVAMNVQALLVEKAGAVSLMSGFHALYSVGGITGALVASALLWTGASVRTTALVVVFFLIALLLSARGSLLPYGNMHAHEKTAFAWPSRRVVLIGGVAFLFMLAEGTMLDWSAIFLHDVVGLAATRAGIGYTAFSLAMTASRFAGGALIGRLGRSLVIVLGAILAASGFVLAVTVPHPSTVLLGFMLIGLGAANLVPLLFSMASEADGVLGTNVSFVTALGYSGVLAGPALIGLVVHRAGWTVAFAGTALVLILAGIVSRNLVQPDRRAPL